MRVKTAARREAILAVATELFRELGFERASMAEMSARLGGSKATLYNYFKSKEELFAAAMVGAIEEQGQSVMALLDVDDADIEQVLCRFGEAYLDLITGPDALALARTAIAEAGSKGVLGKDIYEKGPKRAWQRVSDYFQDLQKRGALCNENPDLMAFHFKGMLEAQVAEPLLWGAPAGLDPATAAASAVRVLLGAYRFRFNSR